MADLKPQIFIGSSGNGLDVAAIVKQELEAVANTYLWSEGDLWEPNESTFDNLLRMTGYFDFGVFVATRDDFTLTSKGEYQIEARNNVILEMTLFVGALGKKKSFLLTEKDLDKPTDFNGIYMPEFTKGDISSIRKACGEISSRIEDRYQAGHLSLYPTTALAIGYYKNFVADLVASMQVADEMDIDGIKYKDFKLKVVMPNNLKGRVKEKASLFYKRHGFEENSLKTAIRKHPIWFQADPKTTPPNVIMYDMPSTLTGIDDAIELKLEKSYKGRTKLQEIIEQRELNNFRKVLQIMLDTSPFAAASVEIIDEF
jgi:Prokaryotic STING domain/CAP12/Pycsar effector protein, TIR domain